MPANRTRNYDGMIYRSLCLSVSDRAGQVDWSRFSSEDWDSLYHTANQERVAALLYWSLSKSESAVRFNIPASFMTQLRSLYYSVWVHNNNLFQELNPMLNELVNAGLQVVLFKGVSLASSLYQDIGLRPMGDLDLLVHESKFDSAVKIAQGFGYKDNIPDPGRGVKELLAYNARLINENNSKVSIEIHTSLIGSAAYNYAAAMGWFWEQTELSWWNFKGLGSESDLFQIDNVYKFSPTAQILYLSVHAVLQHGVGDTQLLWLYDIHRLVVLHGDQIDWNLMLLKAKKFNWETSLSSALTLMQSLFETPIPGEVLSILKDSSDVTMDELLQIKSAPPQTRIQAELHKLAGLDWNARLRLVPALLIPSPEYMRWRYRPERSWTLPYYYL